MSSGVDQVAAQGLPMTAGSDQPLLVSVGATQAGRFTGRLRFAVRDASAAQGLDRDERVPRGRKDSQASPVQSEILTDAKEPGHR